MIFFITTGIYPWTQFTLLLDHWGNTNTSFLICRNAWNYSDSSHKKEKTAKALYAQPSITCADGVYLQGGKRVGLQLYIWKIIQSLTNNNTWINSVLCVLATINLFLPAPPCVLIRPHLSAKHLPHNIPSRSLQSTGVCPFWKAHVYKKIQISIRQLGNEIARNQ